MSTRLKVEVISGVEGKSLYVDDYRVSGPKPWGGGSLVCRFSVETDELQKMIDQAKESEK